MFSKDFLESRFRQEVAVACEICEDFIKVGERTSENVLVLLGESVSLNIDPNDFLLRMGAISLLTALGYIEQHWTPGKNTDSLNLVLTSEGENAIKQGIGFVKSEVERIVPEPTDGKIEDEYTLVNGVGIHVYRKAGSIDILKLDQPVIIDV